MTAGELDLEPIRCPYCQSDSHHFWASERGHSVVRCNDCRFLYLNPRPSAASRHQAVRSGLHADVDHHVADRRRPARIRRYRTILGRMFADVWQRQQPVAWLDVGAGYGEVMEAVSGLAAAGSSVTGVEPMLPKAAAAARRGLNVLPDYLSPAAPAAQFISMVNIFSHIADFDSLLAVARQVLLPGGELFVETGNCADLGDRDEFPGELSLPDHIAFAGERHITGYLERNGFTALTIHRERTDGILYSAKNLAKKALGRDVRLAAPYTSAYRNLLIRAAM